MTVTCVLMTVTCVLLSTQLRHVITYLAAAGLPAGVSGHYARTYISYIHSTNIGTAYFKYGVYSPFFRLQNSVRFIILTYLFPVLFTFYIQGVLKLKKIIPAPKG